MAAIWGEDVGYGGVEAGWDRKSGWRLANE